MLLKTLALGFGMGLGVMAGVLSLIACLLFIAAIYSLIDWISGKLRKREDVTDADYREDADK